MFSAPSQPVWSAAKAAKAESTKRLSEGSCGVSIYGAVEAGLYDAAAAGIHSRVEAAVYGMPEQEADRRERSFLRSMSAENANTDVGVPDDLAVSEFAVSGSAVSESKPADQQPQPEPEPEPDDAWDDAWLEAEIAKEMAACDLSVQPTTTETEYEAARADQGESAFESAAMDNLASYISARDIIYVEMQQKMGEDLEEVNELAGQVTVTEARESIFTAAEPSQTSTPVHLPATFTTASDCTNDAPPGACEERTQAPAANSITTSEDTERRLLQLKQAFTQVENKVETFEESNMRVDALAAREATSAVFLHSYEVDAFLDSEPAVVQPIAVQEVFLQRAWAWAHASAADRREAVALEFAAPGELGISLENHGGRARVESLAAGGLAAGPEYAGLAPGLMLKSVQGVAAVGFRQAVAMLRLAGRPLVLEFVDEVAEPQQQPHPAPPGGQFHQIKGGPPGSTPEPAPVPPTQDVWFDEWLEPGQGQTGEEPAQPLPVADLFGATEPAAAKDVDPRTESESEPARLLQGPVGDWFTLEEASPEPESAPALQPAQADQPFADLFGATEPAAAKDVAPRTESKSEPALLLQGPVGDWFMLADASTEPESAPAPQPAQADEWFGQWLEEGVGPCTCAEPARQANVEPATGPTLSAMPGTEAASDDWFGQLAKELEVPVVNPFPNQAQLDGKQLNLGLDIDSALESPVDQEERTLSPRFSTEQLEQTSKAMRELYGQQQHMFAQFTSSD
jgi:hypothetical protein